MLISCTDEEESYEPINQSRQLTLDCYDFYLWSIGELTLPKNQEPLPEEYNHEFLYEGAFNE